jgi:hypothetical protein
MILNNLDSFINDTENAFINFNLGYEYERIGQTGAAISFYLRTAERSGDDLQQYEALLRCALCFGRQGTRDDTEKVLLQKAIILFSKRPEAYFLLSRLHERKKEWQDCYTVACAGLNVCEFDGFPLNTDVEYPGKYALVFQKGMSSWWVGLNNESRAIMADLKFNHKMNTLFTNAVDNNLNIIGYPNTISRYDISIRDTIRFQFNNLNSIETNYSQTYQDMFVLAMLNGKKNGTYLEIGSAEPFYNNNTALLETKFDWQGISIEINPVTYQQFVDQRKNPIVNTDATKIDYKLLLSSAGFPKDIDYLQIDCDPPSVSFQILKNIPFNDFRFAVITFEHDYYADPTIRHESRLYLKEQGYELIASDIGYDKMHSFEDWWVHPELVSKDIQNKMKDVSNGTKYAKDYMFNGKIVPMFNINQRPTVWIVDNFYSDPDAIREFALAQEYHQGGIGRGYIGRRTFQQFLFPGLKEEFERIMGHKITKWQEHGMNGRFQYSMEGEPLVYHCDSQKWAAMIYLTPNAPYQSGTGTWAVKGTDIRHNSDPEIMQGFRAGSQNLDKTIFERVDDFANVYNRLVIFNAGSIHSASEYFGYTKENCRLWQMFFFD